MRRVRILVWPMPCTVGHLMLASHRAKLDSARGLSIAIGRSVELKTGSTFAAEVAAEVSEHKHHDCKSAKMRLSTAFNRVTRCFRQRGVWRVDMCVRTCFRV
jgi:hypothetical protein